MADDPQGTDSETASLLAWLETVGTALPRGFDMADSAGASLKAVRAAAPLCAGLPFDSEPTGITPLLESLARK